MTAPAPPDPTPPAAPGATPGREGGPLAELIAACDAVIFRYVADPDPRVREGKPGSVWDDLIRAVAGVKTVWSPLSPPAGQGAGAAGDTPGVEAMLADAERSRHLLTGEMQATLRGHVETLAGRLRAAEQGRDRLAEIGARLLRDSLSIPLRAEFRAAVRRAAGLGAADAGPGGEG